MAGSKAKLKQGFRRREDSHRGCMPRFRNSKLAQPVSHKLPQERIEQASWYGKLIIDLNARTES